MHTVEIFVIFSLIVYLDITPFHYTIHMPSEQKKNSHIICLFHLIYIRMTGNMKLYNNGVLCNSRLAEKLF